MISERSKTPNSVLIIGCGNIGQRIASHWLQHDVPVTLFGRNPARHMHLQKIGANMIVGNLDDKTSFKQLQTKDTTVYYLAPPPGTGKKDTRIQSFLESISTESLPRSICYISTSGVYGDHQGGWVTEAAPTNPQTQRSQRRLAAEQTLTDWGNKFNIATVILRVGGIYGPGQLPLARLRRGTPILHRDLAPYSNRIHAEDLARICIATSNITGHEIFNVSDEQHSTMSDYFLAVAKTFNLPPPPQLNWQEAEQQLSAEMLSYLRESRRMDSSKLKQLKVKLRYPTLAEGLKASKEED